MTGLFTFLSLIPRLILYVTYKSNTISNHFFIKTNILLIYLQITLQVVFLFVLIVYLFCKRVDVTMLIEYIVYMLL